LNYLGCIGSLNGREDLGFKVLHVLKAQTWDDVFPQDHRTHEAATILTPFQAAGEYDGGMIIIPHNFKFTKHTILNSTFSLNC